MGEIGLETGSSLEKEILSAQLALFPAVKDAGKRMGIHTPRGNKIEMTEKTLALLASFPGIESVTVIHHTTIDTLSPVLDRGFHAGINLSPPKTSLEDLQRVIKDHEVHLSRIMCNTDSGGNLYSDLYDFYASAAVSASIRNQLACQTAFSFFLGSK
jgi:hypothetical protein